MSKKIIRVVTKEEISTRQSRNWIAVLFAVGFTAKTLLVLFGNSHVDGWWIAFYAGQLAMLLHTHLKLKRIIRENYISSDDQ